MIVFWPPENHREFGHFRFQIKDFQIWIKNRSKSIVFIIKNVRFFAMQKLKGIRTFSFPNLIFSDLDHTSAIVSNCAFTSVSDWRLNNFAIADPFLASVPALSQCTEKNYAPRLWPKNLVQILSCIR